MGVSTICVMCIISAVLRCAQAQLPIAAFDIHCVDKIDNCGLFPPDSCVGQYEAWAMDNCNLTCAYCVGPPTTAPPCVDVLTNCASFEDAACTSDAYHAWAIANCRLHCKLCPADAYPPSTTISPAECVDKEDCRLYGKTICNDTTYVRWARINCMNYCGFCPGLATTPKPCLDTRPNCAQYETEMCTSPNYAVWVEDNCAAYCGRCSGGTTQPHLLTPPPLNPGGTTQPPILTPPPLTMNPGLLTPPLPGKK